jgi:hypothetical protein
MQEGKGLPKVKATLSIENVVASATLNQKVDEGDEGRPLGCPAQCVADFRQNCCRRHKPS